jgi:hypothetical protein
MRRSALALATFLLACGDIKSSAGGDAGADGGTPDARAVGSITVTVEHLFGSDQPLEGNQVVVVDSAGAIAADITTDADGAATADQIEAGSTLIILFAQPPAGASAGRQAIVMVGIEPGDDIRFAEENAEGTPAGSMNVTWPAYPDPVNTYQVHNGCTSTETNDTITNLSWEQECLADGEAQGLVRAVAASGDTLGWLGGTVAFADTGTLDIAGPWKPPHPLAVTLSNIPSEAQSLRPGLAPARGHTALGEASLPDVALGDATVAFDVAMPPAFVDSDLVTFDFSPDQPTIGANALAVRVAADAETLDLSLADELLPWYGTPILDAASRTFSWTRTSGGVEPDAQYAIMFWKERGSEDEWFTALIAPPDVTAVTVPELPADYEQFMPIDPVTLGIQLQAGESSELDGYRAARQVGVSLIYNDPVLGLDPPSTMRRSVGGEDF